MLWEKEATATAHQPTWIIGLRRGVLQLKRGVGSMGRREVEMHCTAVNSLV